MAPLLLLLLFALAAEAWGLAIATMWGWFVVPLGAPAIDAAEAIGLGMTAWMFVGAGYGFVPRSPEQPLVVFGAAVATLCVGWLLHLAIVSGW